MFIAETLMVAKLWKQPKNVSTDGWISKNVIYPNNATLFSYKKRNEISDTCCDMDKLGKHAT